MQVKSNSTRSAVTRASPEATYALLADVVRSVGHFPDLESLTPDADTYLWKMKKVGVGPLSFQSWYAARYEIEPASRSVRWRSVAGRGNTDVVGSWLIEPQTTGTRFTLEVSFALELPLPSLLRGAVEKVMAIENDRIVGQYLLALQATLDRNAI